MKRNVLKFRVSVKPLSPVHIGVGNVFLSRSAFHLYESKRALALLKVRPLAERLVDEYGHLPNLTATVQGIMQRDAYSRAVAHEIESGALSLRQMKVHPGARDHLDDGLKELTALANGLPYIPGSSLKGALRTAWLDWQTQQVGAYGRFVDEVKRASLGRRDPDDALMERKQVAEQLTGAFGKMQPQNRDLFRAVQVSDLLPDKTQDLTCVYAVLSMSYQVDNYARPSNGGRAGAQAWECLNPKAGATYTGTITIDIDLLKRMQMQDRDARNLAEGLALASVWQDALAGYGERVYSTEEQHYEMLKKLENKSEGLKLIGLWEFVRDIKQRSAFPIGMGTGLLAHALLGAYNPGFDPDADDGAEYLGDEVTPDNSETLLKEVLKLGRPTNGYQYQPAPKSRRVTGEFSENGRKLPIKEMRAERPLGWTATTLEHLTE